MNLKAIVHTEAEGGYWAEVPMFARLCHSG